MRFMALLPRWFPQSGWKRWLLLSVLTAVFGMATLVVSAYLLFKIPRVQMWVFSTFMIRGMDKPGQEPGEPRLSEEDSRKLASRGDSPLLPERLFSASEVWPVELAFTGRQWETMKPQKVPPIPNFMQPDGTIVLRNPKASRNGLAGVLGIDLPWSTGTFDFAGERFTNAAIRFKGNGTFLAGIGSYKRPFKVQLDRGEPGRAMAGRAIFNFGNLLADRSSLSDALGYEFFREAGVAAPRTAFARLLISIEGRFQRRLLGLYVMVENPDGQWARERFGRDGYTLFKPVTMELFKDLGNDWAAYEGIYDPKTEIQESAKKRVMDLAKLVTHAQDQDFSTQIADFVDLKQFATFMACETLLANYDGLLSNGQNFLLYLDPVTHRFGWIPWDLDHAWGEFPFIGTAEKRERSSIDKPWIAPNRFLDRVFAVGSFKKTYREELRRLLDSQFNSQRLSRRLDGLAAAIRPFVGEESSERLAKFNQAVSGEWNEGPRDGNPMDQNHPVYQVKRFFAAREQSVRAQLEGREEGVILVRQDYK